MLDLNNYRSILCLNGELPGRNFFMTTLPIIAADGAANRLATINITPSIVIGDLDSVDQSIISTCDVIHDTCQSTSDFQKCIAYLETRQLAPAMIVGINGGHLDHILNNINIFLQTDSAFYAPPMMGIIVKTGQSKSFNLPVNTKISLLGLAHAIVSTTGLKWELTSQQLNFPGNNSCLNRTESEIITINVETGVLLVMIYLEPVNDAGISDASENQSTKRFKMNI